MSIKVMPNGTPNFTHSLLVIDNCFATIILGIFPGMSIPPEISKLINIVRIVSSGNRGLISAAASVALSKMAESIFIQ